jgi:murein DD-endopeptidase MepM/ murein hydrolase activator NlpD
MRTLWAILAGMALLVPAVPSAPVRADDSAAEQAAKEIADARERANAAADALFQAEADLDALDIQQAQLESEVAALQEQIDELQKTVEAVAVNRFTRSGTNSMPLLTGFRTAGDQAQVDVLIDVVNETSADDFDQFDLLSSQLADKRAELEDATQAGLEATANLEQRKQDALDEVEHLKQVEAQRLEDEAVRKALAAEEAERARQAAAQAEQDKQAQRAANSAGQDVPSAINQPTSASGGGSDGSDDDIDSPGVVQGSGSSSAGQTGANGAGSRPGGSPGDLGSPGWLCPVQGPVGFGDTWGAARSGGRTHQGVDMIGNEGLPLVAVVDGFAASKVNTLGGNTVTLLGVDGNRYYYAHLRDWGTLGQVTAGTVIGYVGQTGNAKFSVAHLHFEIHPGGGAAVNPYPTVRAHC